MARILGSRPLASIAALAAIGTARHLPPKRKRKSFRIVHVSRQTLNNPPGSTEEGVRKARNDRRAHKMRLRKLRGWH